MICICTWLLTIHFIIHKAKPYNGRTLCIKTPLLEALIKFIFFSVDLNQPNCRSKQFLISSYEIIYVASWDKNRIWGSCITSAYRSRYWNWLRIDSVIRPKSCRPTGTYACFQQETEPDSTEFTTAVTERKA